MAVSTLLRGAAAASLALGGIAAAEPSFVPVYEVNFPDPYVLLTNGEFIAYATNDGINLPMATSKDLVRWSPVMDPARPGKRLDGMPVLASWAREGKTWAPEVQRVGGKYLLYYTADYAKLDRQCVGLAVATSPRGPFRDTSAKPLICQADLGGTIDANTFRDADGKLYIYYKNDGNRVGKVSHIWVQPMSPDGMKLVGTPVPIARDTRPWEQKLVESPTMVRAPTGYQLFYSGGYFGWNDDQRFSPYAMGYATCAGPMGPCVPSPDNPILHSFNDRQAGCISGPGHQSIFTVGKSTFMAFHAWAANKGCRKAADKRFLYIAPLSWKDGKPVIGQSMRASRR
ncbi:MAG: glycoside hydrolase family 43 protein [Pseudomonadota bacterium]|nr:glycoside hydrolase family 43 protein [Pseudomonadota bacterium]